MNAFVVICCCAILGFCNCAVGKGKIAKTSQITNKTTEQKTTGDTKANSPVLEVAFILKKGLSAVSYGSVEECIRAFDNIMSNHFAHVFMYKFIFAKFLKSMSDVEKNVVNTCTKNFLIDQYSSRFFGYSDAKIKLSQKTKKISDDHYIVFSELVVKNKLYKVDWYMQLVDGKWLVVDIGVNGTNVLNIQRAGLEGALEKSGLKSFIKTFVEQYIDLDKVINRAQSERRKSRSSGTVLHAPAGVIPAA